MTAAAVVPAIKTICTAANVCYNVISSFNLGKYLTKENLLSAASTAKTVASTVSDTKFQYQQLKQELALARGLLKQFQTTIKRLDAVQKEYNLKVCSLKNAHQTINHVQDVLAENFDLEGGGKVQKALLLSSPGYYRELLLANVVYMNASMTSLQNQVSVVLNSITSIDSATDRAERQLLIESLQRKIGILCSST